MKRRILFLLLLFVLLIGIPSGVALAQSGVTVITPDDNPDDVVLFDEDLIVEAGAIVKGDVTLFNGDATIAGMVNGDVVLFDGNLAVEDTAVISGDCVVMSGDIDDFTAVGLSCTNFTPEFSGLLDGVPSIAPIPPIERGPHSEGIGFLGRVVGAIFRSLLLGVLAFAVATLFPRHFEQVESAARQKPIASGTVGFLTSLAIPFLMLLLSPVFFILAFICGLGVLLALALTLAFGGAIAFGWFVAGDMLGRRMADWMNLKNRTLPVTAALGTITLTLLLGLFGAIPFAIGEGLVGFIIACVGLGAVVLTKFGTKSYPYLGDSEADIRILTPEDDDKVTAVLDTLPDDNDTLK
ncbi:MAG: polymer-forming cytoskeletal protein [Chloroflexi bacterium]|nr:polymer-forming cytoskeletal protein [Chloroflexota bacterium]